MRLALIAFGLTGCSLAFPLGQYDEGSTGAGLAATGGNGGSGGDPGGGGGGGPACNGGPNPPLSEIVTDFDAGLSPELGLNGCAMVTGGEVNIQTSSEGDYCWFYTTGNRRLACDSVTVRILEAGSQEVGVQRFIYIRETAGSGALNILQEGGGFGGDFVYSDSSFSLNQDRWWRVSADETTITFATSPDGETWNTKGTKVPEFPMDALNLSIGAGMWQFVAAPGTARFDCFNVPAPCGD